MKFGPFASCGATLLVALALAVLAAPGSAQTQAPAAAAPAAPAASPSAPEEASLQAIDVAARPALVLHSAANWEEGYAKIREGIEKLRAAAQKAGLKVNGDGMAAFTETDDAGFKFDALLPVETAPGAKPNLPDGVALGASPSGKALKFTHTGSYDDIDTTYDAITAYLDEKGLDATNVYLEDYLVEGKDASDQKLKADIYVFLK